ncbi:unnamed protein product [Polarella glacialis]|uniref:RRM domain-containing protein n=1 Tax=Polarella glacialis TaxID=89957 RepID=A0A813GNZ6_POLGL|nr:unnamed protein product [Polarella glacialis]
MGGSGANFAFVEFRTAEEAANGLRLNGVELLGCQLKVGRPKGYTGPEAGSAPLALTGGGGAPSLGEMMAQNGALRPNTGGLALPGMPGGPPQTAIDNRLCLCCIPTFVTEDRIKELLITFGQLKFYALQKDEEGKSVGVAFFEYQDMMTQQQARSALEGLELGSNKLKVLKPDQVIELGLVNRDQKLGARVVPCKVVYLKNVVTAEDLADEAGYAEICADIRLEAEKFGSVVSIEVPRGGGGSYGPGGAPVSINALMNAPGAGAPLALEYTPAEAKAAPAAAPALAPAPMLPDLSMALVLVGGGALAKVGGANAVNTGAAMAGFGGPADPNTPGFGFAFIEFATIEGASKAKKALNGRRFGANPVEAEYFSEDKYYAKDFLRPTPNIDEPKTSALGFELALVGGAEALEEAPALVD